MKRVGVWLLLAALLLVFFCGCAGENRYSVTYTDVFDTVTVFTAYCGSQAEFDALSQDLHQALLAYHRLFDIYREYDNLVNLCTLNRLAGQGAVSVEEPILDLLTLAQSLYEETGGKLNVALGSVLLLWHDAREAGLEDSAAALPKADALAAALAHTNLRDVLLDRAAGTVTIQDPWLRLDVGALAKGWAVERVCCQLQDRGYTGFLLSVGGNVRAVGTKPGGQAWQVGVEDPAASGTSLLQLSLADISAVTSGSYQRYYMVDGRRYHHLIDPDTAYPADHYEMVTVLTPDSGLADALSSALFLLPPEESRALAAAHPEAAVLWRYPDGTMAYTDGFGRFITANS